MSFGIYVTVLSFKPRVLGIYVAHAEHIGVDSWGDEGSGPPSKTLNVNTV